MFAVKLDKRDDFIGKAALVAHAATQPPRKKLVTVVLDIADAGVVGRRGAAPRRRRRSARSRRRAGAPRPVAASRSATFAATAATRAHAGSAITVDLWGERRGGIGVGCMEPCRQPRRQRHARLVSCLRPTALSHLTVLDLTRVRAGPTAVRQLADWGAKVVKIEMPAAMDEGEGVGGPRDGSDFRNVHRNKRGMTLNLKSAEGVAILKKLVAAGRRAGRELPPRREAKARHRLRDDGRGQPAPGLRQHLGLRRGRAVPPAAGLRPDRPGHGRADVDHRAARPGPGARRHPDRRPLRRHLLRVRHRRRHHRAREVGARPVGQVVAAAGAALHARLPGRALAHGRRGARSRPATTTRPRSRPASTARATAT